MLDPTRHVATKPLPQFVCGEGPSKKCDFKHVLIQLNVFNKDRHTAKSVTF